MQTSRGHQNDLKPNSLKERGLSAYGKVTVEEAKDVTLYEGIAIKVINGKTLIE